MRVRVLATFTVFALVVAACGGSEESTPTGDEGGASSTTAATVEGDDGIEATTSTAGGDASVTTAAAGGGGDAGETSARVTIGDDTWEFRNTGFPAETCNPNFFGGFLAVLSMADDNGEMLVVNGGSSSIVVTIPGDDWAEQGIDDPPSVSATISADDAKWVADPVTNLPGVEDGQSQVDEWTIEGNTVTGTATFVEEDAAYAGNVTPVQGTFEVTCSG